MVGADDSEVRCTPLVSTFRHGAQPSGLILLGYALWHRDQVFRINPAVEVILDGRGIALIEIFAGIVEQFYRSSVGFDDSEDGSERTFCKYPRESSDQQRMKHPVCFHTVNRI